MINVNQEIMNKIQILKAEVHNLLLHKLFPFKESLNLLGHQKAPSEDQLFRMQEVIDEIVPLVDAKFQEFLNEFD